MARINVRALFGNESMKYLILFLLTFSARAAYLNSVSILNTPLSVSQSGTWSTGRTWSLINTTDSVNVGNFPGTQAISAASLPLPSGAATSANQATEISTLSAIAAGVNLNAGTNSIGTVQAPTIQKGVQGTNGFMVQNLLDAGRTNRQFSLTFTGSTTEAMLSLIPIIEGVAGTAATSFTPTAGKTFRLQSMCVSARNAGAAAQGVVIQLRRSNTSTVATTSPLVGTVGTGTGIAIANVSNSNCMSFTDGIEWTNGQYFGVSAIGSATSNNTVVLSGFEY